MFFGYGLFALLAFLCGCIYTWRLHARFRCRIVFRHLELIVRQNLPLPGALQLASSAESGATRRILAETGSLVQMGLPLSGALRRAYSVCPGLVLSILESAERSGALPAALVEVNERFRRSNPQAGSESTARLLYCVMTLCVFLLMFFCVEYYTLPRFQSIYADAGIPMPPAAREILCASPLATASPTTGWGRFMRWAFAGLTLLGPVALLWAVGQLRPRRADRLGPIDWAGDFVRWHAWPMRRIAEARGCADMLPILRLACAAGWPLPDAVEYAAAVDTNYYLRLLVLEWAQRLRAGEDAAMAARGAGLPDMLVRCVAMGLRDADMDGPLVFAEHYFSALGRRFGALAMQLVWPLATLLMASLAGSVVWAVVSMLKTLVDQACAEIG